METIKYFENISLSAHRNKHFNDYRKISKFTDLSLRSTDGKTIPVHKIILSASCPYFEGLFNSDLAETRQDIIQLMDDVTIADLEILIEYIYTGKAEVEIENAENLYIKAQYFQLSELAAFCSVVLIENIKIDNCLNYWRNSVKYFNANLTVECIKFIKLNCKKFLESNLMNLTAEEFKLITAEEKLVIDQEDLYKFVAGWVKEDFESRSLHLMELMKNLNFTKISYNFIESEMISDEILQNNKEFSTKMLSIIFEKLRDDKFIPKSDKIVNCSNEKKCLESINLITNDNIFKLNWDEWKWDEQFSFESTILERFATTGFKDNIFISGGRDDGDDTGSNFKSWNTLSQKINELPKMLESRHKHRLIDFKGKIYCCGGEKNNGSMEIFDFENLIWTKGSSMNEHKYCFGLITSEDSLYAIGGRKLNDSSSNVVEQFDPREGKWNIISEDTPSISHAVLLSNNYVYCNESIYGKQIFELRTNKWTVNLADVVEKKVVFSYYLHQSDMVGFKDEIFGIFPIDTHKTWGTFKYDHNANKWANLNIPLNLDKETDVRLCIVSEP